MENTTDYLQELTANERLVTSIKGLLKKLVKAFGRNDKYAELVVERLRKEGMEVTTAMVYNAVNGSTYNLDIARMLVTLFKERKQANQALHDDLVELMGDLTSV